MSSAAGAVSTKAQPLGGHVCAVITTADLVDTPIAFDWWAVRIHVDSGLNPSEIYDLVRLWLLYEDVDQPPEGNLVCWCGEAIDVPDQQ
ncbi:hypothetical protein [Embleya sp. NPDC005971]|uniref:hypothetical protein n=1 Tax=Embleya sp. NPDC005971 TaxID=3156724 RepID=UPI0033BFF97D